MSRHDLSGFYGSQWKRPANVAVVVRTVSGSILLNPDADGHASLPAGMMRSGEDPRSTAGRVLQATSLSLPLGRILAIDYQQTPASPAEAITFIYDGGTYDGGSLAAVAGGQAEFLAADLALAGLGRPQSAQLKAALDAHELLSVLELRDGQRIDTVQRDVPPRELLPDFDATISSGS